jgi:hypothetical protein
MRSLIGAALIAGAFLGPARAAPIPQMQCDRDLLLDMAHEILDRRGQLTGLHDGVSGERPPTYRCVMGPAGG